MPEETYAIIQLSGKQFSVKVGESLVVPTQITPEGESFTISDVLLLSKAGKVTVGTPLVAKASVTAKVLEHRRTKKLRVATFKSKSRTRRVKGHRQGETVIEITAIK